MTTPVPADWLDELADFLSIPSVSADPNHSADVERAAEWVAAKVRSLGGEAELREDGRLVVGEIAGPPGAPTVLVYGHYDVQPPEPLELWDSPPFKPEIRDGKMYGRGVSDDKSHLTARLLTLDAFLAEEGEAPAGVFDEIGTTSQGLPD